MGKIGKKIAIFDFTDCEGYEVELLGLGNFLQVSLNT